MTRAMKGAKAEQSERDAKRVLRAAQNSITQLEDDGEVPSPELLALAAERQGSCTAALVAKEEAKATARQPQDRVR